MRVFAWVFLFFGCVGLAWGDSWTFGPHEHCANFSEHRFQTGTCDHSHGNDRLNIDPDVLTHEDVDKEYSDGCGQYGTGGDKYVLHTHEVSHEHTGEDCVDSIQTDNDFDTEVENDEPDKCYEIQYPEENHSHTIYHAHDENRHPGQTLRHHPHTFNHVHEFDDWVCWNTADHWGHHNDIDIKKLAHESPLNINLEVGTIQHLDVLSSPTITPSNASNNDSDNDSESPPIPESLPVVKIDDPIKAEDIVVPKPEPKPDPVVPKVYHEIQFYQGMTFASIPVSVDGIQTVSDFWDHYSFLRNLNGVIYVYLDGCWLAYNGGEGQIAGNVPLTPYTGLAVQLDYSSLLGMHGIPFPKEQTITLQPGGNFVGFPNLPIDIERPSDLIALGAEAVIVIVKGELKIVGRLGDDGDEPIRPNQALFVITQNTIMLEFEEVLAAPAAQSVNRTFITTWGSQKVR